MTSPQGLVVLISGRGSNLDALARAVVSGRIREPILAVISDRPDAGGLKRAEQYAIDSVCIDRSAHSSRSAFESSLGVAIDGYAPRYIVLAGFMRVLSRDFVNGRANQMINIHPSLLPRYPGLKTHQRALAAGDSVHGASVHFVTPALDGGPVLSQVRLPIQADDSPESLATRLLPLEHQLLVSTTALLLDETVEVRHETIHINGQPLDSPLDFHHGVGELRAVDSSPSPGGDRQC